VLYHFKLTLVVLVGTTFKQCGSDLPAQVKCRLGNAQHIGVLSCKVLQDERRNRNRSKRKLWVVKRSKSVSNSRELLSQEDRCGRS
jgi:hypothetical protein